jgi:putative hemolysin
LDEPPAHTLIEFLTSPVHFAVLGFILIFMLAALSAFTTIAETVFTRLKAVDILALWQKRSSSQYLEVILKYNDLHHITAFIIRTFTLSSSVVLLIVFAEHQLILNPLVFLLSLGLVFGLLNGFLRTYAYNNANSLLVKIAPAWSKTLHGLRLITLPTLTLKEKLFDDANRKDSLSDIIIERSVKDRTTSVDEKEILKGLVRFRSLSVKKVMQKRDQIDALKADLSFFQMLDKVNTTSYSRMPVYLNSIDQVLGILYCKDLLPYLDQPNDFNWQRLIRPAMMVPQKRKLDRVLKEFQEKRVHMALAINEQKHITGLITLEDIIEEIIGDIHDEFDEVDSDAQ